MKTMKTSLSCFRALLLCLGLLAGFCLQAQLPTTNTPPVIRFQPGDNVNMVLAMTNSATFSVTAVGSDPLSYQWYSNGVAMAGANASAYAISGLNAASSGSFFVVISNNFGTVTSQAAYLSTSPNVAVGFDFNTVGQLTNNFGMRNANAQQAATWFETLSNGVGSIPGSLDGWNTNNNNLNTITYLNDAFPWPLANGSALNISIMFKGKQARSNLAAQVQIGFLDAGTNMAAIGTNNYMEVGSAANWLNLRTMIASNYTNLVLQGGMYLSTNVAMSGVAAGYYYYSSNTPAIILYSNYGPVVGNPFTNWYKLTASFTRTNLTNATIYGVLQDMGASGTTAGTNLLVFTNWVCLGTNALPPMGSRLFACFQAVENSGVELVDNFMAWVTPGAPQVTMPPLDQTVFAYRQAALKVKVDGTPMFTFQWKASSDGGTTWTNIPGATTFTYTTPLLTSVGATKFKVAVTNSFGGVESAAGTLTVLADNVAPSVVSVGSADGITVGVRFNEALDPVTAATPGKYSISSGAGVVGASLLPDGQTVKLTVGTAITGAFTVGVNGVKDLAGNAATLASPAGQAIGFAFVGDLGGPLTTGSTLSYAPGAVDQVAGGSDFSGTWDQGQLALMPRTGDFDIKVRVANAQRGRNFNAMESTAAQGAGSVPAGDDLTRCGLMARSSLYPGSTMISMQTYPPDSGMPAGRKNLTAVGRTALYTAAVNPMSDVTTPAFGGFFPNTWMRLKRVNDTFTFYYATNLIPPDSYQALFPYYNPATNTESTAWIYWGSATYANFASNNVMYIGLGTCAHWDWFDWASTVQYRNYGDFMGYPGSSLTIVTNLMNSGGITTTTNFVLSSPYYTEVTIPMAVVAAVGNAPSNEVQFVWQKGDFAGGFTNLPSQSAYPTAFAGYGLAGSASNAVSSLTYAGYVGLADNGTQYRAIVKAPGALSVTSAVFTINVTAPPDTNALQAWFAFIPYLGGTIIDITFNETMDILSVTNLASYTVKNGLGQTVTLTNATLQQVSTNGSPARVVLTTSTVLTNNTSYTVTLNNLRALNGTTIAPSATVSWPYGGRVKVDLFANLTGTAGELMTNFTWNYKYVSNTPDLTFFTNNFSFGANSAGFNNNRDNYGGRISGFFIPPSNGVYRFYIRNDEAAQLWMNLSGPEPGQTVMGTNGPLMTVVTNSLVTNACMTSSRTLLCYQWTSSATYGAVLTTNGGVLGSSNLVSGSMSTNITLVAGYPYYMEGLWKETTGNDGFAMTYRWFANMADALAKNIVPPTAEIAGDTNFWPVFPTDYPLPNTTLSAGASFIGPVRVEIVTGLSTSDVSMGNYTNSTAYANNTPNVVYYTNSFGHNWLAGTAASGAFSSTMDGYGSKLVAYFVPPSNAWYRFFIRSDDTSELFVNTNMATSASPAGRVRMAYRTASWGNYTNDTAMSPYCYMSSSNWYYMEMHMKEANGGDGCSMTFLGFPTEAGATNITTSNFLTLITGVLSNNVVASGNIFRPYPVYSRTPSQYQNPMNYPIEVEIYTNIIGVASAVAELQASPKFQAGLPDAIWYQSYFGWNRDLAATTYPGDYYGGRISGYFVPPSNAVYRFWVKSDDTCQLYMTTTLPDGSTPSGKTLLTQTTSYTANWTGSSSSYNLTNGVRYYMEMLFTEGTGGDGCAMTFSSAASGSPPTPANGSLDVAMGQFFVPMAGPPTAFGISINPGLQITNGNSATLTLIGYTGMNPLSFQWKKNGQPIPDATGLTYTTPILNPADNLVVYSCAVFNPLGTAETSIQIFVINDTSPPALINAVGNGLENQVTLNFSKPLDPVSATNALNYTISDGVNTIAVLAAWMPANRMSVSLLTGPQTIGVRYTVNVLNVKDATANGNPVLPFTQAQFTSWNYTRGLVAVDFFENLNLQSPIGALTAEPAFQYNLPTETRYTNFFGYTTSGLLNYGARAYAWFIAPSNGLYRFYISSDDTSILYMNTNKLDGTDPKGKVPICAMSTVCCGNYGDLTRGPDVSPYLDLVGGNLYYMEADWKQTTGGDYCRVTFREKQVLDAGTPPLVTDGAAETIPGAFFVSLGNPDITKSVTFARQPTNQTINVGQIVVMSVSATSAPIQAIAYQWQKYDPASGTWKDLIYSATNSTPATATLVDLPAASGASQYRALASVPGITITSMVATVTVGSTLETTPIPASLTGVWGNPSNLINVTAFFSEPVTSATAANTANYRLTNMLGAVYGISNAVMLDAKSVLLTLSNQLVPGIQTNYVLVATGVLDVDNGLPSAAKYPFYVADRWMTYQDFTGTSPPPYPFDPTAYPLLTNNVITNTLWYSMVTSGSPYNYGVKPDGTANNYYCQIKGYFIPPSNGIYRFYQASDDASYLLMNVNPTNSMSPAGKQQLIVVPSANLTYANAAAVSASFPMNAGQPYYMEVVLGQSTGGEYVRTAFREYNDLTTPADTVSMPALFFTSSYAPSVPVAPRLAGASGDPAYLTNVNVYFNEAVTPASATNVANYTLTDSAGATYAIAKAVIFDTVKTNTVRLSLATALTGGNRTNYFLTATNIVDQQFGLTNASSCSFYVADRTMVVDVWSLSSADGIYPVVIPLTTPTYNGNINYFLYFGSDGVSGSIAPGTNCNIPAFSNTTAAAGVESYSARASGYIIPPSNGVYKFFLGSDDQGELYMTTNSLNSADPGGIVFLVGNVASSGSYGNVGCPWIPMTAGQRYYFEGRMHEGTGADYLIAGIQEQQATAPTYVAGCNASGKIPDLWMCSPMALSLPSLGNLTFLDSLNDVLLKPPYFGPAWTAQWYVSNRVAGWTPVAGAVTPTLALAGSVTNYQGNLYALIINNGASVASNAAFLTVLADATPPVLVNAAADLANLTVLTVNFNECVNPADATDITRYIVAGSDGNNLTVQGAEMRGCTNVVLTTSPRSQVVGVTYTVTVLNIRDLAVAPNTLVSATVPVAQSVFTPGFLAVDLYYNEAAGTGTAAGIRTWTNSARYLANQPDYRTTIAGSEWHYVGLLPYTPTGLGLNYKARIYGWFVPVVSANYQFYIHADDQSYLTMNINGADPADKTLIASNAGPTQTYGQAGTGNYNPVPVLLNAGQPYYLEALISQGTGQEYWDICYSVTGVAPYSPGSTITGISGNMPGAQVIGGSQFGVYGPATLTVPPTITFLQQPIGTNVPAGVPVTFTALANLSGGSTVLTNLFYQWQCSPDGVAWTNWYPPLIYQAGFAMLGNMSNFTASFYYDTYVRCLAEIPGGYGVASQPVLVSISDYNPDLGSGFFIQSAGSLDGYTVRVVFNRPVDTTYGTATDPGVYTFNGGMVGVLGTPALLADGRTVLLTVDTSPGGNNGPLVGPFSVETWVRAGL